MYDKDVGWGLTTQVNTTEYIGWLLTTSDRAVERAIVCLYNRQTADEKLEGSTKHANGRGFSGSDAPKGSYMAKWILSGKHLTGQYLIDAKMMSFKYINQLVDEATLKLERKAKMEQEAISARIDKEVAEELAILKSEAEEA